MPETPGRLWYLTPDRKVIAASGRPPPGCTHWCREGDRAWTAIGVGRTVTEAKGD